MVCPSTPADNKALLKAAIRSDDPVVYLEHKHLWPLEGEVPDGDHVLPFGQAAIVTPGSDLTIVSWSAQVHVCADAVATLARQGVKAELIDLRTLWPWDKETVLASAARTGRLLIVHEAVQAGGFGAEIAATAAEHITARIRRLGAPRAPIG